MKVTIMNRAALIKLRGEKARSDVAFDLKITLQMLGAIERGDRTPSLYLAKKIADYYGLQLMKFFLNTKDSKCVFSG
ncbi:helix-turn-helix transcriptional regulator [Lysinibacillus sphaericus]|uniref:helix-turn-helix transcriptional regulator n=1 Tax=Lysinibacillus sphaericus TaxID=1421 RepID=UPI001CBCAAB7|nr:helix-turn-helix transcriptional regulator [Lysinibacillus sphaericus]